MKVKRPDGMNDLEYLIFKAKSEPVLSEFVKLVQNNSTEAVFKEASASVAKKHGEFARQVVELKERRDAQTAIERGVADLPVPVLLVLY